MPNVERNHRYMVKTLDTIMRVWYKYPELRLGQLLVASHIRAGSHSTDLFSVEDTKLLEDLDKFDDAMTASGGTADTLGSEPSAPKGA